jgi:hypothetical protein
MHAIPIVASATVQTIVRQPVLNPELPATTIAMAGSQKTAKARHGLERISRDSQAVVSESIELITLRFHFTFWSVVQRHARFLFSDASLSGWQTQSTLALADFCECTVDVRRHLSATDSRLPLYVKIDASCRTILGDFLAFK